MKNKSQAMEMETPIKSEPQLILSIILMEPESLDSELDLIHMVMETHILLDSKILLNLRTIKVEEKLLKSKDKSQTQEVETHIKLELLLIQ